MDRFNLKEEMLAIIRMTIVALILLVAIKFLFKQPVVIKILEDNRKLKMLIGVIVSLLYGISRYLKPILHWKKYKEKYDNDENSVNIVLYFRAGVGVIGFGMVIIMCSVIIRNYII